MFAKVLVLALIATTLTLAKDKPKVSEIRVFVEKSHKTLYREVTTLSNVEYRKIVNSGIDGKSVGELTSKVALFTKDLKKKIADAKEALVVSLTEVEKQGADKLEEAKKVALENIEKARTNIKSKYEELAKRIDDSIKSKLPAQ